MNVIGYLDGTEAARDDLVAHDAGIFLFLLPASVETLVGERNCPNGSDVDGLLEILAWGKVFPVDERPQ